MTTVYFMHDALTPHNVRRTWWNASVVPRVGDDVKGRIGYEGAEVTWTVKRVEWIDGMEGDSVTVYLTGPTGEYPEAGGAPEDWRLVPS